MKENLEKIFKFIAYGLGAIVLFFVWIIVSNKFKKTEKSIGNSYVKSKKRSESIEAAKKLHNMWQKELPFDGGGGVVLFNVERSEYTLKFKGKVVENFKGDLERGELALKRTYCKKGSSTRKLFKHGVEYDFTIMENKKDKVLRNYLINWDTCLNLSGQGL